MGSDEEAEVVKRKTWLVGEGLICRATKEEMNESRAKQKKIDPIQMTF